MRNFFAIFIVFFGTSQLALAEDGGVLEGVAANISAAAPIAVAGVQAGADKAIARINADAQVKMTQITSDTTKYLSDDTKTVAIAQAIAAANINNINQQGVTERLGMQLSELRSARQESEQFQRETRAMEFQYNQERIALAKYQSDQTVALARETANLQMTMAGLTGPTSAFGYGSKLTVTRSGTSASGAAPQVGSSSAKPSTLQVQPGQVPAANSSESVASASSNSPALSLRTGRPASNRPRTVARNGNGTGVRTSTRPTRLLASVGVGSRKAVRGLVPTPRASLVRGSFPGMLAISHALTSTPQVRIVQAETGMPHASGALNRPSLTTFSEPGGAAGGTIRAANPSIPASMRKIDQFADMGWVRF